MAQANQVVFVVDDDSAVREAIDDLLSGFGYLVCTFSSAAEYMGAARPDLPGCLILDLQLPDINGLDLQSQLIGRKHPPIVFITGRGDIPSSVRAMKAGAVDFLAKPFGRDELLTAVESALALDRKTRAAAAARERLIERYGSLTPREREVLPLVISGLLNKQAAARLGISVVTLQIHRGSIMRKMAAGSLAELVRMAAVLDIPVAPLRVGADADDLPQSLPPQPAPRRTAPALRSYPDDLHERRADSA